MDAWSIFKTKITHWIIKMLYIVLLINDLHLIESELILTGKNWLLLIRNS